MATKRKSIQGLSRHGFKIAWDGKWVLFKDSSGKVRFMVPRDGMFDADGNYFKEA
jgi:hypothetical protein